MALPPDLEAILDAFQKGETEARLLAEGLTDAQLNWQPDGGRRWSIAQCLDHLARADTAYTTALRSAVQAIKPGSAPRSSPIQPGWFERFFIRSLEPPPRWKLRAPKKIVPASRRSGEEVLAAFESSHEEIRSLVAEWDAIDLNRIRFKNPFVGILRMRVGAGLLIMAAHDRRHLWQAAQVRARMNS